MAIPSRAGRGSAALRDQAELDAAVRWLENRESPRATMLWHRFKAAWWRRFNRLNAPVVYPWSPSGRGKGTVHQLHRMAADLLRTRSRSAGSRFWLRTKAAGWPLVASLAIPIVLARCGRHVRASSGQSLWEQFRDLCDAAWRHGIFPTEYFHHRVFSSAARKDKSLYLSEREMIALLHLAARGTGSERIDNLRRFLSECRGSGLPVPRIHATFRDGEVEFLGEGAIGGILPEKDLFLRPERWNREIIGQRWRWNAQAREWTYRGESLDAAALLQRCRLLSRERPWALQDTLNNHPDLARLAPGGLCSMHIATGVGEDGEPEVLFASLHLTATAENGWRNSPGELTAGIEVGEGRLGAAIGEFLSDGEFSEHPGDGTTLEGALVPQWSAARDLALRAHRRFADAPFVGWWIAITGSGPMLLEASTIWGVFRHVLPAQTRFAELCLRRIQRTSRSLEVNRSESVVQRQSDSGVAGATLP